MSRVVVRIAPSPTGPPHVGIAYIALFNYAFARKEGGKFILRIEDTDRERSTRESEQAIIRALKWLGIQWDEGPDVGGSSAPYRQSERVELYRKYADKLLGSGWAYRCFCSAERLERMRKAQAGRGEPKKYDRFCLSLTPEEIEEKLRSGKKFVIRLRVPDREFTSFNDIIRGEVSVKNETIDDQVLLKSGGFPTYHLASVVDDHLMGVTHVIRAEEWLISTPKHILLYEAFGWEPPVWVHMPLLRNPDRSKISKRKNPVSLDWYRDQGFLPEALLNFLALMGYSPPGGREIFSLEEMIKTFSFERVRKAGPVFDLRKLEWLNGAYIRELSEDELARRLNEFVREGWDKSLVRSTVPLVQERLKKLSQYQELVEFLFVDELHYDPQLLIPKRKRSEETEGALRASVEALREFDEWQWSLIEARLRELCGRLGWKTRDYFMTLRVAITGSTVSPPLTQSMELLGRRKSLDRLQKAIKLLSA